MRRTVLKRVSITVATGIVSAAVLFALIRVVAIHPAASLAKGGFELFEDKGCAQCHYTDSRETKIGPGLQGLFERDQLPVSGRKVTEENVRTQLKTPYDAMPSFADRLTEEQRDELIEYLKTL